MAHKLAIGLIIVAVAIAAATIFFAVSPEKKRTVPTMAENRTVHGSEAPPRNYAPMPSNGGTTGRHLPVNTPSAVMAAAAMQEPLPADKDLVMTAIHDAAITYDPASLPAIARHLNSSDPEVRAAAVEGVVLLGDAAGASFLRDAAKQTRNAAEAADLRAKADYLELPPAKVLTKERLEKMRIRKAQGQLSPKKNGGVPRRQPAVNPRPGARTQSVQP